MGAFTEKDLEAKGLFKQPNGTWSKKQTEKAITYKDLECTISDIFSDHTKSKYIFIPYDVRSSKNSKQLFMKRIKGKDGKMKTVPAMVEGKAARDYRKFTNTAWTAHTEAFHKMLVGKQKPYAIEFLFARATESLWDFHNIVQLPFDLMVEHGWIADDNIDEVYPVYAKPIKDKNNPGLYIRVL